MRWLFVTLFLLCQATTAVEAPAWIEVTDEASTILRSEVKDARVVVSGIFPAASPKVRSKPYTVTFRLRTIPESELRKLKRSTSDYVFGWGNLSQRYDRPVKVLVALEFTVGSIRHLVPESALYDLAHPNVPRFLSVAKKGDLYVLNFEGPDGSESYDCQFVASDRGFLYRLVRVAGVPGNPQKPAVFHLPIKQVSE